MLTTTLAAYGLLVKPQTARSLIWQSRAVTTPLGQLFSQRLRAELEDRQMSANALAKEARKRGFKIGQRSVSRMLELKQDPTLEKLYEISETLGFPAWYLLIDPSQAEQRVISPPVKKTLQTNVLELPRPYPRIFSKKPESTNRNKKAPSRK